MNRPPLTPVVEALPATIPFVGPEAIERRAGLSLRARVGANESPFGPAPSVISAISDYAAEVWKYGDSENHLLRAALSEHLGVPADAITVGEGIDGLLGTTCRLFVAPGDRVVTSLGAYPTFNYHVAAQGGVLTTVPYSEDREDLEGLIAAVNAAPTRVVYLSNPDNPMGTWWDASAIEAFIDAIPANTLIVLDEAYGETAPVGTLPAIDIARPNLLRMRTFSKAYGLAGLRVGYCIGHPETIAAFDRIRNHFGVNTIAQLAARTALEDQLYLTSVVKKVRAGRDKIADFTRDLGLKPIPSATNFVTVDCGRDGAYAKAILLQLEARGVFIRKPMAPGLDRCIRISVGLSRELDIVATELTATLKSLS